MKPNDPIDVDPDYNEDDNLQPIRDADGYNDENEVVDYADDAEIYDEAWEDAPERDVPPLVKKKKSPLTALLLAGVCVVAGGYFVARHFGDGNTAAVAPVAQDNAEQSGTTASQLDALQNAEPVEPSISATKPAMPESVSQKGFMDDPGQIGSDQAAIPVVTPDAQPSSTGIEPDATIGESPSSAIDPLPEPVSTDVATPPVNPSPQSPSVTAAAPVMPAPAINETVPVSPVTASNSNPTAVETAPSARENELQLKLDDAMKRIDALEGRITAQIIPSNTAPSGEVEALKATIAKLENQVADLQARPAVSVPAASEPVVSGTTPSYKTPVAAKPAVAASKPAAKPVRRSPVTALPAWELRGASSGQALIGRAGSAVFDTIQTGDTVQGIGRVTAIEQTNGRWVVQGTNGSIRQ